MSKREWSSSLHRRINLHLLWLFECITFCFLLLWLVYLSKRLCARSPLEINLWLEKCARMHSGDAVSRKRNLIHALALRIQASLLLLRDQMSAHRSFFCALFIVVVVVLFLGLSLSLYLYIFNFNGLNLCSEYKCMTHHLIYNPSTHTT